MYTNHYEKKASLSLNTVFKLGFDHPQGPFFFTLVGLFDKEEDQQCHTVCALHRFCLGIYWKGKRRFCQIPKEVAAHKKRIVLTPIGR